MATLSIDANRVTISLGWWEKLAAGRSHFTLPMRAISWVEVVDSAVAAAGIKTPTVRRVQAVEVPGITATGSYVDDANGDTFFLVCHRDGPGIVLHLEDASVDRVIISTPDAHRYAQALKATE